MGARGCPTGRRPGRAWSVCPSAGPPPSPSSRSRSVAPRGSSTKPGRRSVAREAEALGAVAAAESRPPGRAVRHDERDGEERLDIVDDGGPAPETGLDREGRLGARHRAPALQRFHERRLLAQHEAAGAAADLHLHREVAAEHVPAHEAPAPGRVQGPLQPARREVRLAVDVEVDRAGVRRHRRRGARPRAADADRPRGGGGP